MRMKILYSVITLLAACSPVGDNPTSELPAADVSSAARVGVSAEEFLEATIDSGAFPAEGECEFAPFTGLPEKFVHLCGNDIREQTGLDVYRASITSSPGAVELLRYVYTNGRIESLEENLTFLITAENYAERIDMSGLIAARVAAWEQAAADGSVLNTLTGLGDTQAYRFVRLSADGAEQLPQWVLFTRCTTLVILQMVYLPDPLGRGVLFMEIAEVVAAHVGERYCG